MTEFDMTLKLLTPISDDGLEITQLVLRELTVAEVIALDKSHAGKSQEEQNIFFFAMACGVSPKVIQSLFHRDWIRLKSKHWEFMGNADDQEDTISG